MCAERLDALRAARSPRRPASARPSYGKNQSSLSGGIFANGWSQKVALANGLGQPCCRSKLPRGVKAAPMPAQTH